MNGHQPIQSAQIMCTECQYDLSGTAVGGNCPECGLPVSQSLRSPMAMDGMTNSAATSAFVFGLLGLIVCQIFSPIAIFIGIKAEKEILQGGYSSTSAGLAKAGKILGIVGTVLGVGIVGFFALMIALEGGF